MRKYTVRSSLNELSDQGLHRQIQTKELSDHSQIQFKRAVWSESTLSDPDQSSLITLRSIWKEQCDQCVHCQIQIKREVWLGSTLSDPDQRAVWSESTMFAFPPNILWTKFIPKKKKMAIFLCLGKSWFLMPTMALEIQIFLSQKNGYTCFWKFLRSQSTCILFLHVHIHCRYSLEVPHWRTSNVYPQHIFSWRIRKIIWNK